MNHESYTHPKESKGVKVSKDEDWVEIHLQLAGTRGVPLSQDLQLHQRLEAVSYLCEHNGKPLKQIVLKLASPLEQN